MSNSWYRTSSTASTASNYYDRSEYFKRIMKEKIVYESPLSEIREAKAELTNPPKKEQEMLFDPEELDL